MRSEGFLGLKIVNMNSWTCPIITRTLAEHRKFGNIKCSDKRSPRFRPRQNIANGIHEVRRFHVCWFFVTREVVERRSTDKVVSYLIKPQVLL